MSNVEPGQTAPERADNEVNLFKFLDNLQPMMCEKNKVFLISI